MTAQRNIYSTHHSSLYFVKPRYFKVPVAGYTGVDGLVKPHPLILNSNFNMVSLQSFIRQQMGGAESPNTDF